MSKIEQNREKKKQAILTSAKTIFLSEGYTSASMDNIAADAQITKQTLYRYFPSKLQLFQATLLQLGESYNCKYSEHLEVESTREAMIAFAIEFMTFHLSEEHIATHRLLIAEAAQAPELVKSFMDIGPDETDSVLKKFFEERFEHTQPNSKIDLWLGMLLAPRSSLLLGLPALSKIQIVQHATEATDVILANMSEG